MQQNGTRLQGKANSRFKSTSDMLPLTYGYGPDSDDLQEGLGSGVEAAMVNGVLDGDIAVQ